GFRTDLDSSGITFTAGNFAADFRRPADRIRGSPNSLIRTNNTQRTKLTTPLPPTRITASRVCGRAAGSPYITWLISSLLALSLLRASAYLFWELRYSA